MPLLSPGLINYYNGLWRSLRPEAGERQAQQVVDGHRRYIAVQRVSGVPWYLVGIIHYLESNFSWSSCLHNGDPLPGPTTRWPPWRGPFASWEEAAIDALHMKRNAWNFVTTWDMLHEILLALEVYNGTGYLFRHPEVNSPYLWGQTNHHSRGKYVADGRYDPQAITRQVGAAAILWHLLKVYPDSMPKLDLFEPSHPGPVTGPQAGRWEVSRLQAWLNMQPGPLITVDGRWGPQTANRFQAVFRIAA
jgi:lysozyme family protein